MIAGIVLAVASSGRLSAQTSLEISQVRRVRALSVDQAGESRPVNVRGVVTVISGWKNSFFFEDATGGISVDRSSGIPALHQGQQIEIRGVTSPGLFAPVILAQEVTILSEGTLPRAPLVDLDKLAGGTR